MIKQEITREILKKINEYTYEIPKSFREDMRVPARVFTHERLLDDVLGDRSLEQLVNVTTLPGIAQYAYAMPDIHQGYGFPIGGVAGMDIAAGGVISPGGIGYDINCGVRLLRVQMSEVEIRPYLERLADVIFKAVPSGVGRGGRLKLSGHELDAVLKNGAHEVLKKGYGIESDVTLCQEGGRMLGADAAAITDHAKKRGSDQLGTLGSGNHFLEIQAVDKIYDADAACAFGLEDDMVTVMIHCGSRGLGHQTCTDYVRLFMNAREQWNITLPDRELICAPFTSPEAQQYFAAMSAASNFAWANRHCIGHWVRESFHNVMSDSVEVSTVYDVSHNIGTIESHMVNGVEKSLIMHRKGATRAFGPGRPETVESYRTIGQPVLIPGTMGTGSYVLVGTEESMSVAFGSSCHGAGRRMSRTKAKKMVHGKQLREQLENQNIVIRCDSYTGLAEEAPEAYKDVDSVIDVVVGAGLAKKVVRLKPIAVIKGG